MIVNLGTLRISEADLARDPYAIIAQVEKGVQVIVKRNHRPVATISTPKPKVSGSSIKLDDGGFARDVEDGIRERTQP